MRDHHDELEFFFLLKTHKVRIEKLKKINYTPTPLLVIITNELSFEVFVIATFVALVYQFKKAIIIKENFI